MLSILCPDLFSFCYRPLRLVNLNDLRSSGCRCLTRAWRNVTRLYGLVCERVCVSVCVLVSQEFLSATMMRAPPPTSWLSLLRILLLKMKLQRRKSPSSCLPEFLDGLRDRHPSQTTACSCSQRQNFPTIPWTTLVLRSMSLHRSRQQMTCSTWLPLLGDGQLILHPSLALDRLLRGGQKG